MSAASSLPHDVVAAHRARRASNDDGWRPAIDSREHRTQGQNREAARGAADRVDPARHAAAENTAADPAAQETKKTASRPETPRRGEIVARPPPAKR
jgi:hypothetical protein